ncbi:transcriptional regulator family: Centromere protein B DNA-binding region [Penicillium canariense]|uniref:Transcriptional regulator family: Centromere protein B DNA-binding region n=1 Tax=Penicillium canariense TaxID=189055 RepID=A0A9W9HXX0_9EURO|nr:transcriptional regulator family: Centromere protein B DNA-binding region [Penicillium canariense]KAJ5160973.1 transcriptional regulator family: Centromere protein B DNA-binding region [Penicillium canariense]
MSKHAEIDESRVIEACEAASAVEKPNLSKIAREYGVSYNILLGRVRQGKQARTTRKPNNKALDEYQEEALRQWIPELRNCHMPVTPTLLEDMANLSLKRAGVDRVVGKTWVYRFIKRLPKGMQLAPVKQKMKEIKRIQAEDAWKLTFWYEKLKNVVRADMPARLIYNFDECGFQPGKGKDQKVVGGSNPPDLSELEHSETITALECIAADGWHMDPLFIFKSTTFQETWFYGSDALPPKTTLVGISPNGWISDELILQ